MILTERNASLGGRTALLYRYFPKMCLPTCGLEINLRRRKANRKLRGLTQAEVASVTGTRDENHLRHCSRICCMASLQQAQYVRVAYGGSARHAGLDGHIIQPKKLQDSAGK